MKIALMHYHLKPGGVTTVLKQQAAAISAFGDVLVLTGQPPDKSFPFDTAYIPGLGYDDHDRPLTDSPRQVARAVEAAIISRWKNGCDLLHVHNPTLKKNRNFLAILTYLQQKGLTLFLQIHDFAEDGRPQVYFKEAYPANCHYGVINRRDETLLKKAGLKAQGLHLLPNTIRFFDCEHRPPESEAAPFILYPIRAIRRKNIGEAILLSLFFKESASLYITLPPNSPADTEAYLNWCRFVKKADLKVVFEAGLRHDYVNLVRSAQAMITTSINEGFGFCFLEPWTAHKALWGRKLPDVCRDFESQGVSLDHLYKYLRVPVTWLGKRRVFEKWVACVMAASALLGLKIEKDVVIQAFERMTQDHSIDFGLLDEAFQQEVINRILSAQAAKAMLIQLNPYLVDFRKMPPKKALITANHRIIRHAYHPQAYGKQLMQIYARVTTLPVRHQIDKAVLRAHFFDLDTFSLLKWGPYAV